MIAYSDAQTGLDVYEYAWQAVLPDGYDLAEDVEPPVIYALVDGGVMLMAAGNMVNISAIFAPTVAKIQAAIDAAVALARDGDTLVVTGSFLLARYATLTLDIPEGVTLRWEAQYYSDKNYKTSFPLITYKGKGMLIVGNDSYIHHQGSGTALLALGADVVLEADSLSFVVAEKGTAIDGAGEGTNVTINENGYVMNYASSNVNPVVNMSHAKPGLLTINGGGIGAEAQTGLGYAIQTYGDVLMNGGEVSSSSGDAVNASGAFSSITVSGGTISSDSDDAISDTGDSSVIEINKGTVSSVSGNAVNLTRNQSSVKVGGRAWVWATTQYTIYAPAGMGVPGVQINGGFVFAYGAAVEGDGNVIRSPFQLSAPGVVVAWQNPDALQYQEGAANNLMIQPSSANDVTYWHKEGVVSGIKYRDGDSDNEGFFPLANVGIVSDYALIFDASGVKATASVSEDKKRITITFSGTPAAAMETPLNLTLPAGTLESGSALALPRDSGAKMIIVEELFAITYYPNGGAGNIKSVEVLRGASHTVLGNSFIRAGYDFTGWNKVNKMLQRSPDRNYIDSHSDLIRFIDVAPTHWAYYAIMEAANTHDFDTSGGVEIWK